MVVFVLAADRSEPAPTGLTVGSAYDRELKAKRLFILPRAIAVTAQRGTVLAPESKIDTTKGSVLLDLETAPGAGEADSQSSSRLRVRQGILAGTSAWAR